MNIRVIVAPHTGDAFEPFETIITRPAVGEYIQRSGDEKCYVVCQIVICESHYISGKYGANQRSVDMFAFCEPAKPRDLPGLPVPL